jgi:hypothetical protein
MPLMPVRASGPFIPVARVSKGVAVRAVGAALLALLCAGGMTTSSAWAANHGPRYTLGVIEGESTLPEYDQVATTYGKVEPSAQVAVSIVRNGTTVYRNVGGEGWASLSQVPQAGETVTLESPVGNLIGSYVYDGLPSIDPTVCAGSTNFSGSNSPGDTVQGSYVTYVLRSKPYGQHEVRSEGYGEAQVKTLSGTTFGGNFLVALALGQTVAASESIKTTIAGDATYTYESERQQPVGACPAPPPPPPPPAPPALQGSILKLSHLTLAKLLHAGLTDEVSINQPGTVVQDLYLQDGRVPASAASTKGRHRHHKREPAALLLARGSATAKSAGTVSISLKLTAEGRRKLKHARNARAVLVTTLQASSGAKLNLGLRTVTLHR